MGKEKIVLLYGTKNATIIRGDIDYKERQDLVTVCGKDRGIYKKEGRCYNIPLQYVQKEREIIDLSGKSVGMSLVLVTQSIDGESCIFSSNTKMVEQYNSLLQENLEMRRELNNLRKSVFDIKDNNRVQQEGLKVAKFAGKLKDEFWNPSSYSYMSGTSPMSRIIIPPKND